MRLIRERNITHTPEETAVRMAISWHSRLGSGHASEKDFDAFRRWLSADPYHPIAATLVEDSWDGSRLVTAAPTAPDMSGLRMMPRIAIGGAAMAALALVAFVSGPRMTDRYATGIGQTRRIALADGSRVFLNAGSRLDVTYGWFSRDLKLVKGDAEFDVTHDRLRPFTVTAAHVAVRAVGTRFAVSDQGRESLVGLTQGVVEIRNGAGHVVATMKAGHKAVLQGDGQSIKITTLDPEQDLAWRNGLVVLNDTSLADAISRFSRYSSVSVRFDDPDLGRARISGVYRGSDVDSFLTAVSRIYNLHIEKSSAGVRNIHEQKM
jgi:transmembrane sensor